MYWMKKNYCTSKKHMKLCHVPLPWLFWRVDIKATYSHHPTLFITQSLCNLSRAAQYQKTPHDRAMVGIRF